MFMEPVWRRSVLLCLSLMTWPLVTSQDSLVLIEGNVTLAAIMEINDAAEVGCGDYNVYSLQELVAVTWFLDSVNDMDFVPGVKIGLDVYRTCTSEERAAKGTVKVLDKYQVGEANFTLSAPLFGMLGPGRTAEATAVSGLISYLPANQQVMQISGSSTGKQLQDRSAHSNFFRVIPPDSIQVQVIMQLLLELQWNYVAIVFDNDDYGRSAAEELRRLAEGREVCIPVFTSLPLDARSSSFSSVANDIADKLQDSGSGLVRGVVVLAGASTTKKLLQQLDKRVSFTQLILSEAVPLNKQTVSSDSGTVLALARGALATSPPYAGVPEFARFWNGLWRDRDNFTRFAQRLPWLGKYFQQIAGCSHASCWDRASAQRLEQEISASSMNLYISYQLKAAAVTAAALKTLHAEKCNNQRTVCSALRDSIQDRTDILNLLRQRNISLTELSQVSGIFSGLQSLGFDSNGEIVDHREDVKYTVQNLKRSDGEFAFSQVGTFQNNRLTINTTNVEFFAENGTLLTWRQLPPAQCQVDHDCLTCENDVSNSVTFIPGDFYVIGLVPVSEKKAENLLGCGEVKGLVGADLAQAIVFAVERVNEKRGEFSQILPERRVGLIVINTCGSPLHVRQKLMDFQAGRLALPDGRTSSAVKDKVMGIVGAFFSANSIAASDTMTSLDKSYVQVSPGSTSPELSDRVKHPAFLRLVPADDIQAKVMLDIVERIGADYIQVIYDSSTAYATALYNKLREEVSSPNSTRKVCIAQRIPITPKDDVTEYNYIVDLLRKQSAARVVVVVLHAVEVNKVMTAILPRLTSDDNFLFLGSETWGRRQDIIQGRTRLRGSLVLAQEMAVDKLFQEDFPTVDPSNSANPWLARFWETKFKCYLNKSFRRKGKTGPCKDNFAEDYKQDALVPFYIQSTYALVKGFSQALNEHCVANARTKCESLTSEKLVTSMHEVTLDLYSTGQYSQVFDDNGNGLVGYKVLQVSLSSTGDDVIYEDVGVWSQEGMSLKRSDLWLPGGPAFSSVCPNPQECGRCFDRATASQARDDDSGYPLEMVVGVAAGCGLLIIVLVIVVVVVVRRKPNRAEATGQSGGSHFPMQERSDCSLEHVNPYSTPEEVSDEMLKGSAGTRSLPRPCHTGDYLRPTFPAGLGPEFFEPRR